MTIKKHKPTAYVEVERITPDRKDAVFIEGFAWDTDPITYQAFEDARRLRVPFEQADYLINLHSEPAELVETICIAELGYRTLQAQ